MFTPDIYDSALNLLYRDVLAHYGVVALPCRVNDPDRKGKVEAGVGQSVANVNRDVCAVVIAEHKSVGIDPRRGRRPREYPFVSLAAALSWPSRTHLTPPSAD
jgi:hypothetical protein